MERMNEVNNTKRKTEGFIRKGKSGGYKEEMPTEFIQKFNEFMKGL